jgi:hypothetical protein
MSSWLVQCEKVAYFAAYQDWYSSTSSDSVTSLEDPVEDADDLEEEYVFEAGLGPRAVVGPYSTFEIAKKPRMCDVPVDVLTRCSEGGFYAPQFLDELYQFLSHHTASNLEPPAPTIDDKFNLYTQIVVLVPGNPQTGPERVRERIRAVPSRLAASGRVNNPSSFGVALVHVDERNPATEYSPLSSMWIALS